MELMDGTSVTLSDVLYIPEVEGSLISVSKLAEKDVVAEFGKDKCVFRFGGATVMEAKRCGNVYKLKTVGDEVCHAATTSRKEPWAVVHARLGHIPFKRYEQLLTMADGVPRVTDGVPVDDVCAGCCMGKMKADDYPRHPEKLVKSAGVLDLVHTDVMGPMQTKTPGGCTYVVTFIDDYSRHVTVHFMKAKSEVLSKFKIFKAAMENATGKTIKRLRSDNGGEYTGRQFKAYLNHHGIKHEKTVPYTPQQNGLVERMNRSLVEMARCMMYHEDVVGRGRQHGCVDHQPDPKLGDCEDTVRDCAPDQAAAQEPEGVWCAGLRSHPRREASQVGRQGVQVSIPRL
jgi:transposase InsO family protein